MQVTVAFVVFQFRFEFGFVGYLTVFISPLLGVVASDVPQFGCGEPALVEVVTNLTVFANRVHATSTVKYPSGHGPLNGNVG